MTGHIRQGSDIDLHVFSDTVEAVTCVLDAEGVRYDTQHKLVRKNGEATVYNHVHILDRFPYELTVYPADKAHYVFKSSITGKAIERASIAELEQFLVREYPGLDVEAALAEAGEQVDRFQVFEALLLPLENVKQDARYHPEGDALYHSLQVFSHAMGELPYDEEFLAAALLHDVGKAIDPHDHVSAGLEALGDFITPRTAWLIKHHMDAHQVLDNTIGARARRRLASHESYEELLLLSKCDRAGRSAGAQAPELEESLDYLRELSAMFSG
jgi:predicted HD phosphohydrolase